MIWPVLVCDGREHYLIQFSLPDGQGVLRQADSEEEVGRVVEEFVKSYGDLNYRIFKYFAREYELVTTKKVELREV